eukprot:364011-Chlamydomonas_euryale.AAC.7
MQTSTEGGTADTQRCGRMEANVLTGGTTATARDLLHTPPMAPYRRTIHAERGGQRTTRWPREGRVERLHEEGGARQGDPVKLQRMPRSALRCLPPPPPAVLSLASGSCGLKDKGKGRAAEQDQPERRNSLSGVLRPRVFAQPMFCAFVSRSIPTGAFRKLHGRCWPPEAGARAGCGRQRASAG